MIEHRHGHPEPSGAGTASRLPRGHGSLALSWSNICARIGCLCCVCRRAAGGRCNGQTVTASHERLASSIRRLPHHSTVQGNPHSAQTPALVPLTRVRGQISVLGSGVSAHASPGAVDVTDKPLQRRISDSPHRAGDCHTTTWCRASLTVLKTPALVPLTRGRGQISVLGSGLSVCMRVRGARRNGLTVTASLQRRMSDSPHRSGDCPTTTGCGASLTVLKHPHCGHSHASVVKYP